MVYCYIRVSTEHQDYDRQENILKENGYINGNNCTYLQETGTGKKSDKRAVLIDLIKNKLQSNDTVVATELSRISRSVKDFNNLIDEILKKKKVNIIIIKENFHLLANGKMDAMTKLILNITSAFAEFEADLISDRTREALKAKKLNGTKTGKPIGRPKMKQTTKENFINTLRLQVEQGLSKEKACFSTRYPFGTYKEHYYKILKENNFTTTSEILEYMENGGDY